MGRVVQSRKGLFLAIRGHGQSRTRQRAESLVKLLVMYQLRGVEFKF